MIALVKSTIKRRKKIKIRENYVVSKTLVTCYEFAYSFNLEKHHSNNKGVLFYLFSFAKICT